MAKVFLLGVGAQKAGTTWLYSYLEAHPECEMGILKEHGVWVSALSDHKPSAQFSKKADRLERMMARFLKFRARHEPIPEDLQQKFLGLLDNAAAEFDLSYYHRHFERIANSNPNARLFGDITPEYSALTADQMARARDEIEGAGYDIRVIFLMRDPVERVYSALRMRDRNLEKEGKSPKHPAHERIAKRSKIAGVEKRTRYDLTLKALDAAFPPEKVYVNFFETLFREETLREICAFLGIRYIPGDFDTPINVSPRKANLTQEQIAEVRAHYDETYRYCAERFGEAFLENIWPHYRAGA